MPSVGLGTFVVGLVAGKQFAASLLSRFWAGHYADSRGAKRARVTGLLLAAVAPMHMLAEDCAVQRRHAARERLQSTYFLNGGENSLVKRCGQFDWRKKTGRK